ncbi:hypothetical protein O9G_003395 [Rozella allomycis CSF55]|uniref:Uncharacterized protein n=1 Tax=Rozella allomycis (strain CSF55) TaxID=988480 RepID=A0A075B3P2_ROZAC|nr:hypothetical protein O9G_003395 [Rozella allomycis CSF55]|eukprot:EPZ35503.1 hypothetical protein O9G_003395 [Rozella allomycis CSF55]
MYVNGSEPLYMWLHHIIGALSICAISRRIFSSDVSSNRIYGGFYKYCMVLSQIWDISGFKI